MSVVLTPLMRSLASGGVDVSFFCFVLVQKWITEKQRKVEGTCNGIASYPGGKKIGSVTQYPWVPGGVCLILRICTFSCN